MKHKENQPLEQLDREIEEIRRLMLRSVQESVSEEKLSRGRPARAAGKKQQATTTTRQWSRWTTPKNSLGSRWISIAELGSS
jgi:hypothetical protein